MFQGLGRRDRLIVRGATALFNVERMLEARVESILNLVPELPRDWRGSESALNRFGRSSEKVSGTVSKTFLRVCLSD